MTIKNFILPFVVLIFLIITSLGGFAFSSEDVRVSDTVYLDQEETIYVTVYNYSPSDKELRADLIAPSKLGHEFIGLKDEIKAHTKQVFKLKLTPLSSSLEGKQYQTTLVVLLGNERVRKTIYVQFLKDLEVEETEGAGNESANGTELANPGAMAVFSLASVELAVNVLLAVIAVVLAVLLIVRIREKH